MTKLPHTQITVLMPVYNSEKYLKEAMESILSQSFRNFEFLIINDGSLDNSFNIISSYKDPRIRLVQNNKNRGLIYSLNKGIKLSKGELIARMDADDISRPDRLEKQVKYMTTHPEVIVCGSDIGVINNIGKFLYYQPTLLRDKQIRNCMVVTCPLVHPSVIYRKNTIVEVGGYDTRAYVVEDYDLWVKLMTEGKFSNISEPLLYYRINPDGESISKKKIQNTNTKHISAKIWEDYLATSKNWKDLWPDKRSIKIPRPNEYRHYAQLHILFSKKNKDSGRIIEAVRHVLAAIFWLPKSPYTYFYLLMFIIPNKLFLRLESFMLKLFSRSK